MKGKWKYLGFALLLVFLLLGILTVLHSGKYGDTYPDMALKNKEIGADYWALPDKENIALSVPAEKMISEGKNGSPEILLTAGIKLSVPIKVAEEGEYELYLEYKSVDAKATDAALTVEHGGIRYHGSVPVVWGDKEGDYTKDRYGNELNKEQVKLDYFIKNPVENSSLIGKGNIVLKLGRNSDEITILAVSQDILIKTAYLVKVKEPLEYKNYAKNWSGDKISKMIVLEGESYNIKSDSFIRGKGINQALLSPYSPYARKMNVIDEDSWAKIGQKILWEFEVSEAGCYNIGYRYSQYSDANKTSYRKIELDGETLFKELEAVPFPSTGLNKYKNYILGKHGENYSIYLAPGKHTISMTAVIGPFEDAYYEIVDIMREISDMGMDLKKMTAGVSDKNRTWDMDTYLPDVPQKLLNCAERIDALYQYLWKSTGEEPVYANDLTFASQTIRNLIKEPRTLPNKTELLNEGDKSVSSSLGNVIGKLTKQPLSIDRIYLFKNVSLPKDSISPFTSLAESVKAFGKTFLPGAAFGNYAADTVKNTDELNVWVNMSIQYTEILQQIVDTDYNSKYGTNIQLSVMPNEQKLVLANATGTNPDVVLGLKFYIPFELALRGAAKNLLEYEDFLDIYKQEYNLEGLTPLAYDNGIYGAVDSLNYQVLFYRKDILKELGLSVPDTWDDVEHMMPELLRYSMNFNTSISNIIGYKDFNATGPFLYQNKGSFYTKDGFSSAFDSRETIAGFTQMTELFQIYALSEYVANFYNSFRYGKVPIGISGFSTYVQLQAAAPELTGLWDIAPVPGVKQEDGSVLRCQAADNTASMIFSNTDMEEEAWRFLKWWLSGKTQVRFAYGLESTFGSEYRWNTANLTAFHELPYPEEHKKVILEQLTYQKENARHPAGYMVEREASNIWNNVVANGKGLIASIDRSKIVADREMIRKLKEFGFADKAGKMIKPYSMDTIEKLKSGN